MPGEQGLQNIHPLVVHYPIAFLTGSILIYCLALAARRESLQWTGLWMLGLGTIGAAIAVWTGLRASDGVMIAPSVREHILDHHKHCMIATLILSTILAAWACLARPMPRRGRVVFFVLLIAMGALLVKGADYGGWMVYGYNAGGSLPQPIEFSQ
jgi:uncharacterized membrane protein